MKFIIYDYDSYEAITRFRKSNGMWSYNPADAHEYESYADAEVVFDALDKVRYHTYYIAEVRHFTSVH